MKRCIKCGREFEQTKEDEKLCLVCLCDLLGIIIEHMEEYG